MNRQMGTDGKNGNRNTKNRGRTRKRLMAVLLAVGMLLTLPGISALAQAREEVENGTNPSSISGNGEVEIGNSVQDNTVSDNTPSIAPKQSEQQMPSNPVHHHTGRNDGTDITTWSYVYFGSYPQSEVTDTGIKSAIDSEIQSGGLTSNGEGIDVWVNGTKYRRISKNDCNNTGYFNKVENNGYRYFKWECIKWRVLQNDGNTLFVAADRAVDCKDYDDGSISITWENCTLRSWLNNSFYKTAFTDAEQGAIIPQTVANDDNSYYGTDGGNATMDNVYLLSIAEVTDENNGFCRAYSVDSASRRLQASSYANARGTWRSTEEVYLGNCWWWLRSPGNYSDRAADVNINGYVSRNGYSVGHDYNGVVPVLHINLSSELWSVADDGTSGEGNTQTSEAKVSSIKINGISKKIAAGKKIQLSVDMTPESAENRAVKWTSSNTKYATVDADGKVTTKKAGAGKSVTITAMAVDGSGVGAQYKIRLMKDAVKKVKISASSKTVTAGSRLKLKSEVTTTGKNANKKLKWTSSNEAYANVSSSGVVKATKAGKGKTVTITAMATDGSGKKAKVKIKIE